VVTKNEPKHTDFCLRLWCAIHSTTSEVPSPDMNPGSYEAMVAASRLLDLPIFHMEINVDGWVSTAQVKDGLPPFHWAWAIHQARGRDAARAYHKAFRLGDPPPAEV
jgi:hypothetical protein